MNCLLKRDLGLGGGGKIKPVRTPREREVLTGSRLRPLPHRHEKTGVHYVLLFLDLSEIIAGFGVDLILDDFYLVVCFVAEVEADGVVSGRGYGEVFTVFVGYIGVIGSATATAPCDIPCVVGSNLELACVQGAGVIPCVIGAVVCQVEVGIPVSLYGSYQAEGVYCREAVCSVG